MTKEVENIYDLFRSNKSKINTSEIVKMDK